MTIPHSTLTYEEAPSDARLFRKVALHILPLLFISYCIAFLDRVNVGFAKLEMTQKLGISPEQYGFAAGIFFLTYAGLELPGTMMFSWLGARKTFLRIMMLWGLTVVATAFVTGATQFYIMRLLLGAFEAGFFPGMILYLTYWFPSAQRGRVTAAVFLANALASTIAGPVSGAIMTSMDGLAGLHGWQWIFIVEGIPACILGILCFFLLDDGPQNAAWLSGAEKSRLADILERDRGEGAGAAKASVMASLKDPAVYLLAVLYFAPTACNYLFNFWLPTMIKESGVSQIMNIAWLTTIPMLCGIVGLIVVNFSSDLLRERRWHLLICYFLAAAGLLLSVWLKTSPALMLASLCVSSFGMTAIGPLFWTLPPTYLKTEAVSSGIGIVSTLGITAGFISPTFLGYVQAQTGQISIGLYTIAILMLICLPLIAFVLPKRATRVGEDG
ncbi:MAG TPA: MFS transporter [Ensifer sp.]|nr:MFS transporter [Ensifer sp.]